MRPSRDDLKGVVELALAEDLGAGDLTACLIDPATHSAAEIVAKESAVLCGTAWFDEVFRQLDDSVTTEWLARDGDRIEADTKVCMLLGPARSLLSGERTALNFLQTLSGTATSANRFAAALRGTDAGILDTRKTLPGLRLAQKYAVRCGGAHNHRAGLYDAVLIKENHILAAGSIRKVVELARLKCSDVLVEIEVETLDELRQALATDVDRIMLDDFSDSDLREAVALRNASPGTRKELEASGGVDFDSLRAIAATGVDWISVGAITKHLRAIDFSMRFKPTE